MSVRLYCLVAICLVVAMEMSSVSGDRGCPDNPTECARSCGNEGQQFGACERRWYRWKLQSRCKCNPCQGTLVLGACTTEPEAQVAGQLIGAYLSG